MILHGAYGLTTYRAIDNYSDLIVGCTQDQYDFDVKTNTCLKVSYDGLTWEDAQESCRHDGGNLISITSLEKWNFVTNYISCKLNGK